MSTSTLLLNHLPPFFQHIAMSQKICDTLRDLVQFKNREKHPWRSVTFNKVSHIAMSQKHVMLYTIWYLS